MPETERSIPMKAEEIRPGIFSIEDNGVRCYLYIGSQRALLVDTGFGEAGSIKAVIESLTDKPIMLVNTHGDHDHIGNNAEFSVANMHPAEMAYYSQNAKPDAQVSPLWEGDIIDLGVLSLEVVLIPGHTPGSIVLLDRENRLIISGDSISDRPIFLIGNGSSLHAFISSLEKLIGMADAFDAIFTAHGSPQLKPGRINEIHIAAKKLLAGELSPEEPPFPLPNSAKMYNYNSVGFFY